MRVAYEVSTSPNESHSLIAGQAHSVDTCPLPLGACISGECSESYILSRWHPSVAHSTQLFSSVIDKVCSTLGVSLGDVIFYRNYKAYCGASSRASEVVTSVTSLVIRYFLCVSCKNQTHWMSIKCMITTWAWYKNNVESHSLIFAIRKSGGDIRD